PEWSEATSGTHVPDFAARPGYDIATSRVALQARVLAPDAQHLLSRAIRDREQHGLLVRSMCVGLPRRHHENVVLTPFQCFAIYRRRALPFCAHENGPIRSAIFAALEVLREEREIGSHGGQNRTAIDRIGVAHACAVSRVGLACFE